MTTGKISVLALLLLGGEVSAASRSAIDTSHNLKQYQSRLKAVAERAAERAQKKGTVKSAVLAGVLKHEAARATAMTPATFAALKIEVAPPSKQAVAGKKAQGGKRQAAEVKSAQTAEVAQTTKAQPKTTAITQSARDAIAKKLKGLIYEVAYDGKNTHTTAGGLLDALEHGEIKIGRLSEGKFEAKQVLSNVEDVIDWAGARPKTTPQQRQQAIGKLAPGVREAIAKKLTNGLVAYDGKDTHTNVGGVLDTLAERGEVKLGRWVTHTTPGRQGRWTIADAFFNPGNPVYREAIPSYTSKEFKVERVLSSVEAITAWAR